MHFSLAREVLDEFGSYTSKFHRQSSKETSQLQEHKSRKAFGLTDTFNTKLFGLCGNVDDMLGTIKILSKQGRLEEALLALDLLNERGFHADDYVYVCLLQLCISHKAFVEGKQIHGNIVKHLSKPNIILSNVLINLYAKCGCISEARRMFDRMQVRDIFSWTIMIEAFAKYDHSELAIKLFIEMEDVGVKPDDICYLSVLKACGNLDALGEGKIVHACISMCYLKSYVLVGSSLIEMYTKCASLDDAWHVFLYMENRDVVVWNLMIAAYAEFSCFNEAFKFWELMKNEGVISNGFTFFSILKACSRLDQIKLTHISAINTAVDLSLCFFNSLVNMYFKFGASAEARQVFDRMPNRDVVSWNSMLSGYVQQGFSQEALELLEGMGKNGVKPDYVTFSGALKACTRIAALEEGKEIHRYICATGMEMDKFVTSTLIDMYGKCGDLEDAQKVFNDIQERDVVIWNSMIAVLVTHEHCEEALQLFQKMGSTGVKGDDATFVIILKACAYLSFAEQGMHIHAYIIESRLQLIIVQNALIDMYSKCRMLYDARVIFNKLQKLDVGSWNAMISGYAQLDHSEEVLNLFQQMQQGEVKPDKVTFLGVLKAYANLGVYEHASEIQACISKAGFGSEMSIRTTMVDMYAKCGRMDVACHVFNEAPERDIISWNAVITGHSQQGHIEEAFKAFLKLLQEGIEPDDVTFIALLKVCASAAAVEYGKQIHTHVRETIHGFNDIVKSTLFDMYAKSGSVEAACKLFEEVGDQDRVSCNAMIAGYAQHGLVEEALKVFGRMRLKGGELDHVSYIAIISACSHMGLVAEGCDYFMSMGRDHGILPSMELYACLVDLLGRSGHLDEALLLVENMYIQPNVDVWIASLSACKFFNYADLAKNVARHVLELEPENTAAILLPSNIFVLPIND